MRPTVQQDRPGHAASLERAIQGVIDPHDWPRPVLVDGIKALAEAFDDHAAGGSWTCLPLLMADQPELAGRFLQLQQLDREIDERLCHLQQVCRKPRTLLKLEEEHLKVDQVRRLSNRSVQRLMAHTEDWAGRGIRSIHPKRLLGMIAEDDWDLYENRVAARLIDHLLQYLSDRFAAIEPLLDAFREIDGFSDELKGGSFLVRRLSSLWGESFDSAQQLVDAEATYRYLQRLELQLLGLKHSDLYEHVPPRAQVGQTLKQTNILLNDQHYRHVAGLWQAWSRRRRHAAPNPEASARESLELAAAFERYALMLVGRALRELGFEPPDAPERGGAAVRLRSPQGDLSLSWTSDGAIRMEATESGRPLVFRPLALALDAPTDPREIARLLEPIADRARRKAEVLLYPGETRRREALPPAIARRLNTLGLDARPEEARECAVLPISPLDLRSLERVMRVLQHWLLAHRFGLYPAVVPDARKASEVLRDLFGDWLEWHEPTRSLRVLRRPKPAEAKAWDERIHKTRSALETKGKRHQDELEHWLELDRRIKAAAGHLAVFLACPVCREEAPDDAGLVRQGERGFKVTCWNCSTVWGTQTCAACRGDYAVLLPGGWRPSPEAKTPGWLDRVFGKDILASPCWAENAGKAFICSNCGHCGGNSERCGRCG